MKENLYLLLKRSKETVNISVPTTLVIGFGFEKPTLILYEKGLKFKELTVEKAWKSLAKLFTVGKIIFKSESESEILTKMPEELGVNSVYQMFCEGQTCLAKWSSIHGFFHNKFSITLRIQFERLKEILNQALKARENTRLTSLEAKFLISSTSVHCLAVTNYSTCSTKPPTRVHSFDITVQPSAPLKNLPQKQISQPKTSQKPQKKHLINDQLSDLMKNSKSAKYIRYKQWKNILDQGGKLLSNEMLYSKKIAEISTRVLVKSTTSLKTVRKMSYDLRNLLIESEFFINRNELAQAKRKSGIETYRISLKPLQVNKSELSVIDEGLAVDKILNQASTNLDSLRRTSFLTVRKRLL